MVDKKVDNKIIELKKRINEVDNKLDSEKKKLQKLDKMQEEIDDLSRNIDKCIHLLSMSIKGEKTANVFNNMSETNTMIHAKTVSNIQVETEETQKNINKLYGEKENIIKENRNKAKAEIE